MKRRVNLEKGGSPSEMLAFQVGPISSSVCHYLHAEIYRCTKLEYSPNLVSVANLLPYFEAGLNMMVHHVCTFSR